MALFILLALLNGVCIALSRILNGQLCRTQTAFKASYINHLVGFVFLSAVFTFGLYAEALNFINYDISLSELPTLSFLYFGGVIGALYVAVNSYIMPRLGSTNAIVLVISGQMLFGVVLEVWQGQSRQLTWQLLGVALIIGGILQKERRKKNP